MGDAVSFVAAAGLVGAGLIGGTLFAFSTFIMAALRRLPDAEGVRAMQRINTTVFTPWFMGTFFGTTLLSIAAVVLAFLSEEQSRWAGIATAGAIYVLGVFVVTAAGNVPLNNALDRVDADAPETAEFWSGYLRVWTRWNHLRAAACVASILLFGASI